MSLSIGIVGLPNVGKSTLFNALLKRQAALAANYPFATVEPNVGMVDVPDVRLQKLAELVKKEHGGVGDSKKSNPHHIDKEVPEKIIPSVIKFYDIAGLVKGASQGEGLGNKFLSHIREVDAIAHVVRAFEDTEVVRADSTHPLADIEIINTELILADLQTLEKIIPKAQKEAKRQNSKEAYALLNLCEKLEKTLNNGEMANILEFDENEQKLLKQVNLITIKPVLYVFNVDEDIATKANADIKVKEVIQDITDADIQKYSFDKNVIYLCAKLESELSQLDEEEQQEYMQELGIHVSGLDKVIKRSFDLLGLQTYLTAGPKEVRSWTIKKGYTAPQAAGVIHTDFERGFISAEVINYADLLSAEGWKNAKSKGLIRIEGKNYVMQDGDVVEFRFSV